MARYTPDPTKDTAGFEVLPKGDYRLCIGEPKAFEGETKEGANKGQKNYGVAFLCVVVEGPVDNEGHVSPPEHKGKKVYQRLFYHTKESSNFSKGFILAALGYTTREEKEFNEALASIPDDDPSKDWSFDTESGECGEAWRGLTGREIIASLSVTERDGKENQKWDLVRPVPSV